MKNQYRGLKQFVDLRRGLAEKEGVVFVRVGGLISQCNAHYVKIYVIWKDLARLQRMSSS